MALTNYTELKASLANWLNRSDLTTEIADDFIKLAEADFNSKLRVRAMIAQVNITVDAETEALPTDFLQIRNFYILSGQYKNSTNIRNSSINGHNKWNINYWKANFIYNFRRYIKIFSKTRRILHSSNELF